MVEAVHEGGDGVDGAGGAEGCRERRGIFVEAADHAGDVDDAAAGSDVGEEGGGEVEGAVVVGLEGLVDDFGVCEGGLVRITGRW